MRALLLAMLGSVRAFQPQYPFNLAAAAKLLEVQLPSPRATVRAAYRKKASTSHPDVSTRPDAVAQFMRITAAYEVLLQFSMPVAPPPPAAAPRPPPQQAQRKRPSAASRRGAAPSQAVDGDEGTAQECGGGGRSDSGRFEQRVSLWRDFWQARLQATHLAHEAERKAVQQLVLQSELARLRTQLHELVMTNQGRGASVDACRARYAQASARHADVECAVRTLRARAALLHKQAERLQELAQQQASP